VAHYYNRNKGFRVVSTILLQNRSTFFHFEPVSKPQKCEKGRCYMKRYSRGFSEGLVRDLERTCDAMYIDEQIRPHEIPRAHDTCRGMAAAKWGPMKLGEITLRVLLLIMELRQHWLVDLKCHLGR